MKHLYLVLLFLCYNLNAEFNYRLLPNIFINEDNSKVYTIGIPNENTEEYHILEFESGSNNKDFKILKIEGIDFNQKIYFNYNQKLNIIQVYTTKKVIYYDLNNLKEIEFEEPEKYDFSVETSNNDYFYSFEYIPETEKLYISKLDLRDFSIKNSEIIDPFYDTTEVHRIIFAKNSSKYVLIKTYMAVILDAENPNYFEKLDYPHHNSLEYKVSEDNSLLGFHFKDHYVEYIDSTTKITYSDVKNYGFVDKSEYFIYNKEGKNVSIYERGVLKYMFPLPTEFQYVVNVEKKDSSYYICSTTEIYDCYSNVDISNSLQFLKFTPNTNKLDLYPNLQLNKIRKMKLFDYEVMTYNNYYFEIINLIDNSKDLFYYNKTFSSFDFNDSKIYLVKDRDLKIIDRANNTEVDLKFDVNLIDVMNFENELYLLSRTGVYKFDGTDINYLYELENGLKFQKRDDFFFVENSGEKTIAYINGVFEEFSNIIDSKKYYFRDYNLKSGFIIFSDFLFNDNLHEDAIANTYIYKPVENKLELTLDKISHDGRFINDKNILLLSHDLYSFNGVNINGYFKTMNIETKEEYCINLQYQKNVYSYILSDDNRFLYSSICGNLFNISEICEDSFIKSVKRNPKDFYSIKNNHLILKKNYQDVNLIDIIGNEYSLNHLQPLKLDNGLYLLKLTDNGETNTFKIAVY